LFQESSTDSPEPQRDGGFAGARAGSFSVLEQTRFWPFWDYD
jgi:hypothetical protein